MRLEHRFLWCDEDYEIFERVGSPGVWKLFDGGWTAPRLSLISGTTISRPWSSQMFPIAIYKS